MKSKNLMAGILIAMLPNLSGCGGEPGVGDLVDEYLAELNEQTTIVCDCWEDAWFESRTECMNEWSYLPSQLRCIKDALSGDPEAARQFLGCRLPLEREYTQCLYSRLDCDDGYATEACNADFDTGSKNCIDLPMSVERAMEECFD
jgi:hypothetical protein